MAEYVKRDDVWQMLHDLGGCEDNFSTLAFGSDDVTWANGWDKAIEAAIDGLEELPTVELMEDSKIYLKPCPFCGGQVIRTEFLKSARMKYEIEIGCKSCNYHLTTVCNSKRDYASLDEILEFSRQAADNWNRRYNERKEIESEAEENA